MSCSVGQRYFITRAPLFFAPRRQRCEAFSAAFCQKYLSCVALALPVPYPVMGWHTTGKASATLTESVQKCFTALPEKATDI
jgi:hypothetical protein